MSADIAALGKGLIAEKAFERLASIVSSEVISEITGFLENLLTTRENTLEVLFVSEGLWIVHFDDPVPLFWNSFKVLLRPFFTLKLNFLFDKLSNLRILLYDLIEVFLLGFFFSRLVNHWE